MPSTVGVTPTVVGVTVSLTTRVRSGPTSVEPQQEEQGLSGTWPVKVSGTEGNLLHLQSRGLCPELYDSIGDKVTTLPDCIDTLRDLSRNCRNSH